MYNAGSSAVSLSQHFLSDNRTELNKWAAPSIMVPAGSFVVFNEINDFHAPLTSGFGLNKTGEDILLSTTNRVIDSHAFSGEENGRSLSRIPDGSRWWQHTRPTSATTNFPPVGELLITEVMYNPPQGPTNINEDASFEFIEIYNPTLQSTNLFSSEGPYKIRGGSDYDFPPAQTLGAETSLLVVPFDPTTNAAAVAAFETHYHLTPGAVPMYGPYSGTLSDRSDRITLERIQPADAPDITTSDVVIDELIYLDQGPFTDGADGTGQSLHRLSARKSGNDPQNWEAAMPSPDQVSLTELADEDGDALEDNWEQLHFSGLHRDGSLDFDGDGFIDRSEFVAGTLPLDAQSLLRVDIEDLTANSETVTLRWPSVAGRTYRVYSAPSALGPFTEMATGIAATPPLNSLLVDISGAELTVFLIAIGQ